MLRKKKDGLVAFEWTAYQLAPYVSSPWVRTGLPNWPTQTPLAPSSYEFRRNVQDYGAKCDSITDDTEAINTAVAQYSVTDTTLSYKEERDSTTVLGALVYFPMSSSLFYQNWILTYRPAYRQEST